MNIHVMMFFVSCIAVHFSVVGGRVNATDSGVRSYRFHYITVYVWFTKDL